MKSTLALMLLAFSMNSFASGGFFCDAKIRTIMDETSVSISGSTGHVVGNPLISGITISVDGTEAKISKKQVVGYWGEGPLFQLHVVDPQAEYSIIQLSYDQNTGNGELVLDYGEVVARTYDVSCSFE